MIRVINIRNAPKNWDTDPAYLYIGRAGHGHDGYWGNPYNMISESERVTCIRKYDSWLDEQLQLGQTLRHRLITTALELPENCYLVCFCAPRKCHGDILAERFQAVRDWDRERNTQ